MTKEAICEHCGAKMIEYRFAFNKGLAAVLLRLFQKNSVVKLDDLGLTYSQRTNCQKLRYWGLALPYLTEDSKKKAGVWYITEKGRDFVLDKISIPAAVITRRNVIQRFDEKQIAFSDVLPSYEFRGDYQEQAREQIEESRR